MTDLTRRAALVTLAAAATSPATGQQAGAPPFIPFRFEDVVRRARDLAATPFDGTVPPLPEPIANLDFDAYRDIRFRPDRALLNVPGRPFRLQLFHLGFLYNRPVTVNVIRDGVPTPVPYGPQLFDFGRTKVERPLPVNLGFAGFRIHYPVNSPKILDELVAFLGASYYRFLSRGQQYGISARGLSVNVQSGEPEEFPFFREFWIDVPAQGAERITIFGLLDGAAVAGAYRFEIYPSNETTIEVSATLFPRRQMNAVGLAPLTSMYFSGENERRTGDDFRPELHDTDGLLVHLSSGEWLWRPIRNPGAKTATGFGDTNPRGFGLMQRDRNFESYQDLEAGYQLRPSYWVEPAGNWGEGRIELIEIPTAAEVHDNVVAYWTPRLPYEAGQEVSFGYRIKALDTGDWLHPGGKVVNTFVAPARASGSVEAGDRTSRRFLVDFAGGDLSYYRADPSILEVVPTVSAGRILATSVVPNDHTGGFRAAIDVKLEPGQSTDLRAYLRSGGKALTETWTYRWTAG